MSEGRKSYKGKVTRRKKVSSWVLWYGNLHLTDGGRVEEGLF